MKIRTPTEIKAEVKKLEALKSRVRRTTSFGDDNWAAIDASIKALKEGWSENMAYDRLGTDDRLRENAVDAIMWRDGEKDQLADDPEGWLSIAK